MERQNHGLIFEQEIIDKYGMEKSTKMTSKFDAYYKDIPVSIKLTKLNSSVSFGDIFRQSEIIEDFILISGFWKGKKNNIEKIDVFYIDSNIWKNEFKKDSINQIRKVFDGITNSRSDDSKWKTRRLEYVQLWKNSNSKFTINFKRDHKNQKRVQCSLSKNNYKDFMRNFIRIEDLSSFEIIKTKGTTGSKGKKETNDKFYTKKGTALKCIKEFNLDDYDCIIEPSAGSGNFSSQIKGCFAYDIMPEAPNIIQQDWLSLDKKEFSKYNNILVIGNPPYGKNNSLSLKFIKESKFANVIGFILPRSFKKQSMLNKLPLNLHLQKVVDLEENIFLLNDKEYSLPTSFFIFEKRDYKRIVLQDKIETKYFTFVKKNEAPHYRIQRVGGNSGSLSKDFSKSSSSNYFIKVNTDLIKKETFEKVYQDIDFKDIVNNTIGPKSLSKRELISLFEEEIKNKSLLN